MSEKGRDSISGFYYQTAVGVIRLFEMLENSGPYKIEFEGIGKYSEDITIFWEDKILYEQVKRRGNRVWIPSEIREIIQKHLDSYSLSNDAHFFRFATNSIPSPKTFDAILVLLSIKHNTDYSLSKDEENLLKEIIPIAFDREKIQRISEKFDFVWGFHYSSDLRDQVASIRQVCVKKIEELCGIDYDSALSRFSELCEYVFHISSKIPGIVLRKDIRRFFPEYFERRREIILGGIERSFGKTLSKIDFDYLEINKHIRVLGNSIRTDIYMEIGDIRMCIWRLSDTLTSGEIRSIHDSVRSLHMYQHILIIRNKLQMSSLPNELRSISILFNDFDGLMIKIKGDNNA